MESEAAPTGSRLESPKVFGGKSNNIRGNRGAASALFSCLFSGGGGAFWTKRCYGALWKEGRGGRLFFMPFFGVMAGERGGGELGGGEEARWAPFFHAFFWGVRGAGFAEGACRGDGICRGGGQERGWRSGGRRVEPRRSRAVFLLFGGQSRRFLRAAVFFGGRNCVGEAVRGECAGGGWKAVWGAPCRKSGAARLAFSPAAAPVRARERRRGGAAAGALKSWRWRERGDGNEERVGGGGKKEEAFGKIAERFVWGLICLRQGSCSVERSIRGSSHKYHKYRANISPPSRGRKGLLPKA